MGIGEYLVVAGLFAGFTKYQIDVADRQDKRMDKLEKEQIIILQKLENYALNNFHTSEIVETRIDMMISVQSSFIERAQGQIDRIKYAKSD